MSRSTTLDRLLLALSDGEFHSGQALGEALGVSRSAVWKQLKKLESLGIEIYSVKGRGYRLPGGVNLLNGTDIVRQLNESGRSYVRDLNVLLSTESTNRDALMYCQQGDAHGAVYVAEQQTAGRGRRGRSWVSPFGSSLYFSSVWRFEQGMQGLDGLSLLVGLCVQKAIAGFGVDAARLKWPNDILCDGKKLAGILLEVHGEPSGQCQVVVGVGVNVSLPRDSQQQIDQPWTDLCQLTGRLVSRNELAARIINELATVLPRFEREGFRSWRNEWQALNAFAQRSVRLVLGHGEKTGVCVGVDESGALLIETPSGIESYHAGEISVRAHD